MRFGYVNGQKIRKPNNFKVFGDRLANGPTQESPNQLKLSMLEVN